MDEARKTVVTGVEMFRKILILQLQAITSEYRGVQRTEIERGQVLAKPVSITPHTKFTAQVYVLTASEGGRSSFLLRYRPQFYFRTTDVTGNIKLPDGVEMCMPGDHVTMEIELLPYCYGKGLRLAIREGGRTVGSGAVVDVIA